MYAYTSRPTNPPGWGPAIGAVVSRAAFPELFAIHSTFYGAGDGSTTFVAGADLRGVFVRGLDNGRGLDPGRLKGSYQADQNKEIVIPYRRATPANGTGDIASNLEGTGRTATYGAGQEARPKNVAERAIMKYYSRAVPVNLNASIPPPTLPATPAGGDPNWQFVEFLTGFEGTEGSTDFIDEGPSALTLTGVGNAKISTEWSAFGGSSLKLDQPNVDSPQSSVMLPTDRNILITGDYTLDVRCRFASLKDHSVFGVITDFVNIQMGLKNIGNNSAYHIYGGQGNTQAFEPLSDIIAANTLVTLRYARKLNAQGSSFIYYTFVNGTLVMNRESGAVEVLDITGANIGWTSGKGLNGNIDEIRLTNGICRSTDSYTVDTAPFPRY